LFDRNPQCRCGFPEDDDGHVLGGERMIPPEVAGGGMDESERLGFSKDWTLVSPYILLYSIHIE
ncbi:MAG: hypothetical protein OEY91_06910, partial [Nitrospirota bacterium]|nr:hypothetical protein [Nitrospirota bacterium]